MKQERTAARGPFVFVSDVHLQSSRPERTRAFIDFLAALRESPRPAGLFILGDLFDVWLGRHSVDEPAFAPVFSALRSLAALGVQITVFQGNRDFLLDGRFSRRAAATLIEEGLSLPALGAFLCHGDRLLVDDRAHQRLRWILRSGPIRALADLVPSALVVAIARWLMGRSDGAAKRRPARFLRFPAAALGRLFRGGFDVAITGHLHEERRLRLEVGGRWRDVYTLGAWEDAGSVLHFDGEAYHFRRWPIPGGGQREISPCSGASS